MAVQAQSSLASAQPSTAEARGRVLLNLRLRDAEGGLLGRTLLTLIANKVGNAACPQSRSLHDVSSSTLFAPSAQLLYSVPSWWQHLLPLL